MRLAAALVRAGLARARAALGRVRAGSVRLRTVLRTRPWPRIGEVVTVVAACLALVVSVWTASGSNVRADRSRDDDLRARLRDDMAVLGELEAKMRGDEAARQAASLQLGVRAVDAWEIINALGADRVSPVDLALTAQALATSGMAADAEAAMGWALRRQTGEDVRVVLLNSAISVYYQTGDLTRLRAVAGEVVHLYTDRLHRRRAEGNGYANLGAVDEARTRYVWAYAEAAYRNCDRAEEQYDRAVVLTGALDPPASSLPGHRANTEQILKQNCPAVLPAAR
ncbi:hypothetical protein [Micromonospora sp. SH-82]|uniref:hypothetical protein n=1 Tax=Micromonospora sp. SH-82 TaxID=3132938 RepID=UPI003EB8750C